MRTYIRSIFFAAAAITSVANASMAGAASINDFFASFPGAQEKTVNSPAQDYIDSFNGKGFTAAKREGANPSSTKAGDPAESYIDSFSGQAPHIETSDRGPSNTGEILSRPSTLLR